MSVQDFSLHLARDAEKDEGEAARVAEIGTHQQDLMISTYNCISASFGLLMSRSEADIGFLGYRECTGMTFVQLQLEASRLNCSTAHVVNAPLASFSNSLTFLYYCSLFN